MDENIRWALGIVATIFLAFAGFVTKALKALRDSVKDVENRVGDVKENYVRRDDLASQLATLDRTFNREIELLRGDVGGIRSDLAKQHERVIAALTKHES